ncbi:uncharacterized protein IUM83_08201 [Phytophthora cinnamomi]|uniref:uncharacterized protein n=1 Tax=Phytophthora cinnamomi TaxID=4785 RepID=UPI0035595853|nr:hypothetical protein IUM83_08201 [Phytophthora cinnamomi]
MAGRGRRVGYNNYTVHDQMLICQIVEQIIPLGHLRVFRDNIAAMNQNMLNANGKRSPTEGSRTDGSTNGTSYAKATRVRAKQRPHEMRNEIDDLEQRQTASGSELMSMLLFLQKESERRAETEERRRRAERDERLEAEKRERAEREIRREESKVAEQRRQDDHEAARVLQEEQRRQDTARQARMDQDRGESKRRYEERMALDRSEARQRHEQMMLMLKSLQPK